MKVVHNIKLFFRIIQRHWIFYTTVFLFIISLSIWVLAPSDRLVAFFGEKSPWEILTYIGICCGGILLLGSQHTANRRNLIMEKGQLDIRFKDAALLLANNDTSAALSGVYALHQIALESSKEPNQSRYINIISSVLCAYLREHSNNRNRVNKNVIVFKAIVESLFYNSKDIYKKTNINLSNTNLDRLFIENPKKVYIYKTNLFKASLKHSSFKNAVISGTDLACANLLEADFTGAKFVCVDFTQANLTGAKFIKANFKEVCLYGATLSRAYLTEVNLFRGRLKSAILFQANLTKAKLIMANLFEANLTRATLIEVDLTEACLTEATFSSADLTGAKLVNADLTKAILNRAKLINANLSKADLTSAKLIGADLSEADLTSTKLIGADLTEAKLVRADLSFANLTETRLVKANLSGADLFGADLTGANLEDAILDGIDFSSVKGYEPSN